MTLICDTGPLVASTDRDDQRHERVAAVLRTHPGPLIVPAPVTAEVDYLVRERVGPEPARKLLEDIADGRYRVVGLEPFDHQIVADVDRQYADLGLGLADLSIVVLAKRFDTRQILTFDGRDFRAVRPLQGGSFTLLPTDEPAS